MQEKRQRGTHTAKRGRGRGGSPAFEHIGGEREERAETLHRPAAEEGVEALRWPTAEEGVEVMHRPATVENAVRKVTARSRDHKICAAKKMDAPHGHRVLVAGVQQPHRTLLAVRAWSPVVVVGSDSARSDKDLRAGARGWSEGVRV
jgi:hypothetical protein